MPVPTLPVANTNPFYNPWKDAVSIARDTFTGSMNDVKTIGGILPGETGATGEKVRAATGSFFEQVISYFGEHSKDYVVYGIAILFVVFGLKGVFK